MAVVIWSPQARADLAAIEDYYVEVTPEYDDVVVNGLLDSVRRLEVFPFSGRAVPEIAEPSIREVVWREYRVIHWTSGSTCSRSFTPPVSLEQGRRENPRPHRTGRFYPAPRRSPHPAMPIRLPDEARAHAIAAIQRFFETERDETVGDLHASFLLDAVLAAAAPAVYNRGVCDAQAYVGAVVADLDVTLCEPESAPARPR